MRFIKQIWTLVGKNLRILFLRHTLATVIRALWLPVIITTYLSFFQNLLIPNSKFGIADPAPIRSFGEALELSTRTDIAFVNNGLEGGLIDEVIAELADIAEESGKIVHLLSDKDALPRVCKSTLMATSNCYGAVEFWSSPEEGEGGIWNYTLRMDGGLGFLIDMTNHDNDQEVYILPFQKAVDTAVTTLAPGATGGSLPETIDQYGYTDLTPEERRDYIRQRYQDAVQDYFSVAFLLGLIGVVYHMTGFIATEREIGMSQLIEAMMPTRYGWMPQMIRFFSYHIAFSILYLPAHLIGAFIIWRGVFVDSRAVVFILYWIIIGWSLTSMSLLGAAFFKKSQLSGIIVTIITLGLGIVAQVMATSSNGVVTVLSLLFTPCNFVYYMGWISRFQQAEIPADLTKSAPDSPWSVTGIVFWVFAILQILVYPLLGALVERSLYGSTTKARRVLVGSQASSEMPEDAVKLDGFNKIYRPNFFARLFGRKEVHAVKGLTINARKGQILGLLGANGSGKSTTLNAIAGTNRVSSGDITIDGTGGLGIAPQKNVLWDDLSVEEHISIFNRIKAPNDKSTKAEILKLIQDVDLEPKKKSFSKTLSGGQKRKLQLGMMLTGGSAVCCVDEVSSGLDPLSRRKIWDILLAERGSRTMILTTHFLDEADLLADHIVVLSKGTLRAQGSSVELKTKLGGGYRIHLHGARSIKNAPSIPGVTKKESFDVVSYIAPSSALAAQVIKTLEVEGHSDYRFSGPTIEDVFLQLAEEAHTDESGVGVLEKTSGDLGEKSPGSETQSGKEGLELLPGKKIGFIRQAGVLFLKRFTILKSNWFPYLASFILPILAAGLTTIFVSDEELAGCEPAAQSSDFEAEGLTDILEDFIVVGGPSNKLTLSTMFSVFLPIFGSALGAGVGDALSGTNVTELTTSFVDNIKLVDTFAEFNEYLELNRKNVTPGGFWLGDETSTPTLAWDARGGMFIAGYAQNAFDMLLTNTTIASTTAIFDLPFALSTGDSLQLLVYFALAISAFPGFFALYPNNERRKNVRGLQYSNGVRSLPLWLAYLSFDFGIMLVSMVVVIIIWAALTDLWYHMAYMFPVLMLYSLASILLAYVISLFSRSQLSSYALVASLQASMAVIYIVAYMCVLTYSDLENVSRDLEITHWTLSLVAPICSVVKALLVGLNIFSEACKDEKFISNPAAMDAYGGPILYLVLQSLFYFLFLVAYDSGVVVSWFKRLRRTKPEKMDEAPNASDEEVAAELVRVTTSHSGAATRGADGRMSIPGRMEMDRGHAAMRSEDGLKVVHLTKKFGKTTAVDNVTFGIQRGEVFALLGPNGAGKSTTISIIRGDIQPSTRGGGDVFVEDISVTKNRASARAYLGVCPQFDAVDSMTVVEHLKFYARVRGVEDIDHNVQAVLDAVGLQSFKDRMAGKLSGGNKRKLSLGIALMGNPAVVLLDEPSSGLDAAAKRVMWKTLARVVPGRSILLTTHSMEEADALAGRAGILSRRMLAMGTAEGLRKRWGDLLYVHLVCKGAPRTDEGAVQRIKGWVRERFGEGVEVEEKSWHGQMRFTVPAGVVAGMAVADNDKVYADHGITEVDASGQEVVAVGGSGGEKSAIGKLVVLLEEEKERLGVEHFSVSPTTLDQVFLNIVGKHNVKEENYGEEKKRKWWSWKK